MDFLQILGETANPHATCKPLGAGSRPHVGTMTFFFIAQSQPTMSDSGSDFTEQTGMVSEFTLEREVRRERAAAAAPADPAAVADPTNTSTSLLPSGGVTMTHSYSYRSGVEESKIPEEPDVADGQQDALGEEEDLIGDDDDGISSSVISQKQRSASTAGTGSHKSTFDTSSSSQRDEHSTSVNSSASPSGGRSAQREKIQAAVGKARQASSRAVQSVIQYEREHAIVEKAWAGMQQGVRYAGRKVRECTSVDTTTPN